MKISEALLNKADLEKKNLQILSRIKANATIQEGEESAENVESLLKIYSSNQFELEKISISIATTNAITKTSNGISIATAIVKKELLKKQIEAYREIYESGTVQNARYSNSEIKRVRTFKLEEVQSKIDSLSKEYRQLDYSIQEANWSNDIITK